MAIGYIQPSPVAAAHLSAAQAFAADRAIASGSDDEARIRDLLETYREATERGEPDLGALMDPGLRPEQRAKRQHYFESVRDLRVTIDEIDIAVVGDEAVVSYTRTDDFIDAATGRPIHVSARLTKLLRREAGIWKVAGPSRGAAELYPSPS
jgi:ketosteroid isomerase-like protein